MRPPARSVRPTTRRTSVGPTARSLHTGAASTQGTPESADRREMLAPPAGPRRARRSVRLPRMTRGRALLALAVSLVVLLGGTLAARVDSRALGPDSGSPVAPAAAAQPLPLPTVDPDPCAGPAAPPICSLPTSPTTPPMTGLPLPTEVPTLPPCDPTIPVQQCAPTGTTTPPTPCSGEGCIPQPGTTTAPPTNPGTGQPGQGEEPEDECGITDIGACITEAINAFFRGIVTEALNPLLDLLSKTLLTTPMPDSLPRVGELWDNSWQILLISYGLLVLIAGVIAMGYQTVQTRHSIKELTPRLVIGFLAGALSLWVATKGIQIANALVAAIMGGGVDANSAGQTLRNLVLGSLTGGIWIIFIGIVLAGMLVALLITYVVRVALTIILIAGAPLALMFHALPQTEGIAYWWWKAYGGCLAVQVVQSLTLITAMKVFLAPGGFTLFGPTMSGLVNLLVALALMYILFKIPFWVLSSIRGGGGRSLIGSLARGYLAYKTFSWLGRRGGGHTPRRGGGNGDSNGKGGGSDPSNGYANPRTTADGQYVLPLPGVRRTRSTGRSKPKPTSQPGPKRSTAHGRQLALPLSEDWPENKPVLGRDGQYRLPLDVQRVQRTTLPPAHGSGADTGGRPSSRKGRGRQLELPFDPYKGNRPTRSGQYPLPLDGVRRVPRPASLPPASAPPSTRSRVVQPELPFDPYQGNRPTRSGQYPLPLDGVRRTSAPQPAPAPPRRAAASRPAPRTGGQLRLPLDLPKPAKPPMPRFSSPPPAAARPSPKPGGKKS